MSLACVGSTCSVPAIMGLPLPTGVCFPRLHCSGSRLLSRERALSCMHFLGPSRSGSGSLVLHKGADSVGSVFCAFPGQSSSGRQELDELTLPGCSTASPLHGPSLSFWARPVWCILCPSWGADLWLRPSQWMSTIQNLRKSLVRNWKPVCSLVGDVLSGADFAPFRLWLASASPLPPAGDGLVRSQLALL